MMLLQTKIRNMQIDQSLCLILFAVLLVHLPVVLNDFHTDDFQVLMVMDEGFSPRGVASMDNSNYFRPVSNLVIYLRYWLFGKSPFFWYLINICLHLLAVSLLYQIIKCTANKTTAILAGLFFGIYFQHFEGVLWLYGLVRLLAAVFLLSALKFHQKVIHKPSLNLIIKTHLFLALAVFCVEDVILFSLYFLVSSIIKNRKSKYLLGLHNTGYILIPAIYIIIRVFALSSADVSTEYFNVSSGLRTRRHLF